MKWLGVPRASSLYPRSKSKLAASALIVAAAGTMVQARLNAELVLITGNPLEVSLINLVVAAVVASVTVFCLPNLRESWFMMARAARQGELRPWQMAGGALGGYYLAIQGSAALAVGVAVFTVAVVAGQTGAALVVDWFGLSPVGHKTISLNRMLAAALAVGAVLVVATGQMSLPQKSFPALPVILLLAASAGCASALQQAVSGHVAAISGRGITAAWVNFVGGAVVMAIVVAMFGLGAWVEVAALPPDSWWLCVAGVFGLVYIATVSWVVRLAGVLVGSLMTLIGLLIGAVLLDFLAPTRGSSVTWQLLIGVALTAVAVWLSSIGSVAERVAGTKTRKSSPDCE